MKTLKPIIQTEEPDKYGRTVKIGITDGTTASFFQVMSMGEVRNLRDELTKFLKPLRSRNPCVRLQEFRRNARQGKGRGYCSGTFRRVWYA